MKGSNKIVLNQQEMCVAMQKYVDGQFTLSPGAVTRVTSEKDATDNRYGGGSDAAFVVVIDEPKATTAV